MEKMSPGCGEAKLFAEQNRGWTENAHN